MSSNNNISNGSTNQMLPHKFNKLQKQTSAQNVSNLMIQEKEAMNSTLGKRNELFSIFFLFISMIYL